MLTHRDLPNSRTVELKIKGKIGKDEYMETADHLRGKIQQWGSVNLLEDIESFRGFELGAG